MPPKRKSISNGKEDWVLAKLTSQESGYGMDILQHRKYKHYRLNFVSLVNSTIKSPRRRASAIGYIKEFLIIHFANLYYGTDHCDMGLLKTILNQLVVNKYITENAMVEILEDWEKYKEELDGEYDSMKERGRDSMNWEQSHLNLGYHNNNNNNKELPLNEEDEDEYESSSSSSYSNDRAFTQEQVDQWKNFLDERAIRKKERAKQNEDKGKGEEEEEYNSQNQLEYNPTQSLNFMDIEEEDPVENYSYDLGVQGDKRKRNSNMLSNDPIESSSSYSSSSREEGIEITKNRNKRSKQSEEGFTFEERIRLLEVNSNILKGVTDAGYYLYVRSQHNNDGDYTRSLEDTDALLRNVLNEIRSLFPISNKNPIQLLDVVDASKNTESVRTVQRIKDLGYGRVWDSAMAQSQKTAALKEIGINSSNLHLQKYGKKPLKMRLPIGRGSNSGSRYINFYTKESARYTLDVAIKNFFNNNNEN